MKTSNSTKLSDILKEQFTKSSTFALLFFTAQWSGSSSIMQPVFEAIEAQIKPGIPCYWLTTETHQNLLNHLHIQRIPCVLCLKEGELIGQAAGILSQETLKNQIQNWITLSEA